MHGRRVEQYGLAQVGWIAYCAVHGASNSRYPVKKAPEHIRHPAKKPFYPDHDRRRANPA
ncbi:hypothetical protein GCM10011289_32500 [Paludibacterium paludis]|uniref:Uncharacterized protein n=1 Tax=Paludibacterium paludis TaxID=1225769 RepID=A0A918P6I7_9NEIS|nr:hypothetical protein GCM10011289_32500 [Paludibacterium paludis]